MTSGVPQAYAGKVFHALIPSWSLFASMNDHNGGQAVMLRLGLNAGDIYPQLAAHMGAFTARTLFNTSLLALDSSAHRFQQPACFGQASSLVHDCYLLQCSALGPARLLS